MTTLYDTKSPHVTTVYPTLLIATSTPENVKEIVIFVDSCLNVLGYGFIICVTFFTISSVKK